MFNFDPFEPMQTVCGVDGQRVDGVGLEASTWGHQLGGASQAIFYSISSIPKTCFIGVRFKIVRRVGATL